MSFEVNTLTNIGATLLAQATVQDSLVIVGCDVGGSALTVSQARNVTQRIATPLSNTTQVTPIDVNQNHVYCRAYFRAGVNTGGDFNTLYLYGHLESSPSTDVVIFVASSSTPFHLPESGDVIDEWECKFDIQYNINLDSVIFDTFSAYATQSELTQFKNDMLSAATFKHQYGGSATIGVDETIYGVKTFNSYIVAGGARFLGDIDTQDCDLNITDGNVLIDNCSLNLYGYGTHTMCVGEEDSSFSRIDVHTETLALGSSYEPMDTIYIYTSSIDIEQSCIISGNDNLSVGGLLDLSVGPNVSGEPFFSATPYINNKIYMGGNIEITPNDGTISASILKGVLESLYDSNHGVGSLMKVQINFMGGVTEASRGDLVYTDNINYEVQYGYPMATAPSSWKFRVLDEVVYSGIETWVVRVE